jgi:1-deoxy-D-xylulose 5-phosphate reductoisomerase
MQERVAVLGATGSIGRSTLDLMALHHQRFRPVVLAAHRQAARMAELCEAFQPELAVMTDPAAAAELRQAYLTNPHDLEGVKDTIEAALNQTPEEGRRRMRTLRRQVLTHDVDKWARSFLDALAHTKG